MLKTRALLLVCLASVNIAYAGQNVYFTGDFESGEIQDADSARDGFFIKTLPNPQGSVDQFVLAKGGGGPNSNLDSRVVRSEQVGGELVKPRKGDYFLRSAIYFDKKYDGFAGNSGKNKPRAIISMARDSHRFDYDVEGYAGFSVYLPKNLEDEMGKTGEQGKNMLMNISAPGAAECFTLSYWVPSSKEGGGKESHWWIRLARSARSTDRDGTQNIDLGSLAGDKGKWTDFVIRFRCNPFSVDTNPYEKGIPNAKNQLYKGNKGILQIWKGEGPVDASGNRRMVLKLNKVNTPIGLVPHKEWKLGFTLRQYKHGWHQQDTTVKGPVWIGFDEVRFGLVNRDRTSYSDVQSANLACTDSCPPNSGRDEEAPPNPPDNVTIVQQQ